MIPSLITVIFVIVSVAFNFYDKMLHGSYWQHYLSLHRLLFMLISQCRASGQTSSHCYLPTAEERGALMPSDGNFEVWGTQLSDDGQLSPLSLEGPPPSPSSPAHPAFLLWVSHTVGLMPFCASAFLHPCSCPSPTALLPPHITPLPPHSPALTTTAPLFIPPWVNQIPFSSPCPCRHTQQTLSCKCRAETNGQPFYLETNHRKISVALSWNMPGLDGIFRCQNLTSLYRARTNCKDSNA